MQPTSHHHVLFKMVKGTLHFLNDTDMQPRELKTYALYEARLRPHKVFTVSEVWQTYYVKKKDLLSALRMDPHAENSQIDDELTRRRTVIKQCYKVPMCKIAMKEGYRQRSDQEMLEARIKAWVKKIENSNKAEFQYWLEENPEYRIGGFELIQGCLGRVRCPEGIMHRCIAPSINILQLSLDDLFALARLLVSKDGYKTSWQHLPLASFSQEQKLKLARLATQHLSFEVFKEFCFIFKKGDEDQAAFTTSFLKRKYFQKLLVPFENRAQIIQKLHDVTPENFSELMAAWFEALDPESRLKLLNTIEWNHGKFQTAHRLASGGFRENIRPYLKAFSLADEEQEAIEAILIDPSQP